MPSKSKAQKKFMRIAAHSPEFAAKAGIDQSVAKEFYRADKAREGRRNSIAKAMAKAKSK